MKSLLTLCLAIGLAVSVASCSKRLTPRDISDIECMSIADTLQTLQIGDPLPRVVEVLGPPSRTYRSLTTFGSRYDTLEYDTGTSPCAQYLLNSPRVMALVFDSHGQLIGYGRKRMMPMRSATSVRLNPSLMGQP
jgi:hypothetical protein